MRLAFTCFLLLSVCKQKGPEIETWLSSKNLWHYFCIELFQEGLIMDMNWTVLTNQVKLSVNCTIIAFSTKLGSILWVIFCGKIFLIGNDLSHYDLINVLLLDIFFVYESWWWAISALRWLILYNVQNTTQQNGSCSILIVCCKYWGALNAQTLLSEFYLYLYTNYNNIYHILLDLARHIRSIFLIRRRSDQLMVNIE